MSITVSFPHSCMMVTSPNKGRVRRPVNHNRANKLPNIRRRMTDKLTKLKMAETASRVPNGNDGCAANDIVGDSAGNSAIDSNKDSPAKQ